ncbi:bacterio-opsin activator HTH domain-containing protein [Halosimplex carlsbadense 2-9-1]|uniref:Bacterio-opsin activator HTH domain-containing protein n=1 Tax=Halosimplex carlsbadense 2-9-1 TaxID=797114 RepID=M0CQS3_9EURY|nr:helix-turn-helix domain-containing protein [Halosimplex carlsbadense]ELZ25595.1 bacterio-opsin activator HTH domain-containing protein [Halosimplex carlsbadense 2-9-1]
MSVIAEISIPSTEFELGRIMDVSDSGTVELESLVPTGERAVPFFWVYGADFEAFEETVFEASSVEDLVEIDTYDDRVLYTFEWSVENDAVFRTIRSVNAYILNATGTGDSWRFELRFPSHDAMSTFQERCRESDIGFEVIRVYNPSKPDLGPWFGLTERQREAIVLAVEEGYYDIPRDCTTVELAEQLGISDQAVTERLRRAIVRLVTNTILTSHET